MEAKFEFTLDPLKEADRLSKGLRNKAIRKALNKAAGVVKAQVVANAPRRFGYLQKSFRIKLKNYKGSNVWVAVVGPKSNFTRQRKGKKVRPSNYAKLLEQGTKKMTARPFLKPALSQTRTRCVETLRAKLRELVQAELRK